MICIDFQFLLSAYGVVRFIQFFIIIVSPDRAAALRFSFLYFLLEKGNAMPQQQGPTCPTSSHTADTNICTDSFNL